MQQQRTRPTLVGVYPAGVTYPSTDGAGPLTAALAAVLDELAHASRYYRITPPSPAIGEVLGWATVIEAREAQAIANQLGIAQYESGDQ